jgi:hypothetical protein
VGEERGGAARAGRQRPLVGVAGAAREPGASFGERLIIRSPQRIFRIVLTRRMLLEMRWWSDMMAMLARPMSSLGKSWSQAKAVCPRPEHAGSRVRLAGHNGPPEHHRQRYMCVPDNGDRPHRFSEALPREESWTG